MYQMSKKWKENEIIIIMLIKSLTYYVMDSWTIESKKVPDQSRQSHSELRKGLSEMKSMTNSKNNEAK